MFLLTQTSRSSGGMSSSGGFGNVSTILTIIALVVAFIVAIVLFVTIIQKKKAPKGRFTRWLREYLNFRSILISGIIKFVYVFLATFLSLMSIVVMCSGSDDMILPMIGTGLLMLVFGNILLRIMMELCMALIVVWENTSDIRSVVVKKDEAGIERPKTPKLPDEPKPEAPRASEPEVPKPEAPRAPESPKVTEVPKAPEAPRAPETPRPEAMRTGMPEKSETVVAERREITINGVE